MRWSRAFAGYALYPQPAVKDTTGLALLPDRQRRPAVERHVDAIAELLEIAPVLERCKPIISAGQRRRTGLAGALVRDAGGTGVPSGIARSP